jgi:hypothetical protein
MDGLPELSVVAAPVDGGADDDDVPCAGLGWTLGKGTQLSGVVIGTHSSLVLLLGLEVVATETFLSLMVQVTIVPLVVLDGFTVEDAVSISLLTKFPPVTDSSVLFLSRTVLGLTVVVVVLLGFLVVAAVIFTGRVVGTFVVGLGVVTGFLVVTVLGFLVTIVLGLRVVLVLGLRVPLVLGLRVALVLGLCAALVLGFRVAVVLGFRVAVVLGFRVTFVLGLLVALVLGF